MGRMDLILQQEIKITEVCGYAVAHIVIHETLTFVASARF